MRATETLAAIDIGSNAVRFLVEGADEAPSGPRLRKLAFLRIPLRLGECVFSSGAITEAMAASFMDALNGFVHIMRVLGVSRYRACATSAMREAANGTELVASARERTGLVVEIISGEREADVVYAACAASEHLDPSKNYLYVDVGGGSTETILYKDGVRGEGRSFRLGTVRLLAGVADEGEFGAMVQWIRSRTEGSGGLSIVGSGGNINKIAKMLKVGEDRPLTLKQLKELQASLTDMTFEQRVEEVRLNPYRADVILPAMRLFVAVAEASGASDIFVPKVGLVDGIINGLSRDKSLGLRLPA